MIYEQKTGINDAIITNDLHILKMKTSVSMNMKAPDTFSALQCNKVRVEYVPEPFRLACSHTREFLKKE